MGPPPFVSRVDNKEKLGINVPRKIIVTEKKEKQSGYLEEHRKFIAELNKKKKEEKKGKTLKKKK